MELNYDESLYGLGKEIGDFMDMSDDDAISTYFSKVDDSDAEFILAADDMDLDEEGKDRLFEILKNSPYVASFHAEGDIYLVKLVAEEYDILEESKMTSFAELYKKNRGLAEAKIDRSAGNTVQINFKKGALSGGINVAFGSETNSRIKVGAYIGNGMGGEYSNKTLRSSSAREEAIKALKALCDQFENDVKEIFTKKY